MNTLISTINHKLLLSNELELGGSSSSLPGAVSTYNCAGEYALGNEELNDSTLA